MMEWEWACWIFLHLMGSGSCTLVTVHQPAVLTTALGRDVIMPCHLNLSSDEKPMTPPVLYWHNVADNAKVWTPTERYAGRVDLVDQDLNSPNKAVLLKNVQWVDSGKYLCKVSISLNHNRFRTIGNETLLVVYDAIIFDLGRHNDSQLLCEVKVSADPGFVLSIFHNGDKLQTADGAAGEPDAGQPYVTLSKSVPLRGEGQYECQLHLNEDLVTNSTFSYLPSGLEKCRDAEKNVSTTCVSDVEVHSEPWLLYGALLLVPITILLGILTLMLMHRVY